MYCCAEIDLVKRDISVKLGVVTQRYTKITQSFTESYFPLPKMIILRE